MHQITGRYELLVAFKWIELLQLFICLGAELGESISCPQFLAECFGRNMSHKFQSMKPHLQKAFNGEESVKLSNSLSSSCNCVFIVSSQQSVIYWLIMPAEHGNVPLVRIKASQQSIIYHFNKPGWSEGHAVCYIGWDLWHLYTGCMGQSPNVLKALQFWWIPVPSLWKSVL